MSPSDKKVALGIAAQVTAGGMDPLTLAYAAVAHLPNIARQAVSLAFHVGLADDDQAIEGNVANSTMAIIATLDGDY